VLYSWAKLQGAKYRDFSASRREYRAQMRHRAAEIQRESERRAQLEAEAAAAATEKAAREAEVAARFHENAARQAAGSAYPIDSRVAEAASARAMQTAEQLARKASGERIEAARRAEAVAAAEEAARREEREIAEAHASAQRQAQRYEDSEARRRVAAGPQPTAVGGRISDPYTIDVVQVRPDRIYHQPVVPDDDMQPSRHRQSSRERVIVPQPEAGWPEGREYRAVGSIEREAEIAAAGAASASAAKDGPVQSEDAEAGSMMSPSQREAYAAKVSAMPLARRVNGEAKVPQGYRPEESSEPRAESPAEFVEGYREEAGLERRSKRRPIFRNGLLGEQAAAAESREGTRPENAAGESTIPAWIHGPAAALAAPRTPQPMSPVEDTLQHSRERVASRWFALKGVFDHQEPQTEAQPQRVHEMRMPILTVFSLAGGVGKTSLIATLGRALSSTGERVLLTDTTSHGLLPFYFGANELRPGVVRTFSPPEGSADAPIYLVSYDVNQKTGDSLTQDWLSEELLKNSRGMQRVLVDLTPGAAWAGRRLARMNSTMLVPVAPDMNSVISLQGVDKFFGAMADADGQPVRPFYVLNQFDASLPLHLDVREVMRQQLGDRLLPFAIRRSPAVAEALAEGMTVMDYAPDVPVTGDYMNLLAWLRTQSAPAPAGFRNARWSER
jgi:cellulose synthase operon protein YhjQ